MGLKPRQITPTQLPLFRRSPVFGAWWEELKAQGLFKDKRPGNSELENQLFADGLHHKEVLISKPDKESLRVPHLPGKQNESDYQATKKAMADGYDFI